MAKEKSKFLQHFTVRLENYETIFLVEFGSHDLFKVVEVGLDGGFADRGKRSTSSH